MSIPKPNIPTDLNPEDDVRVHFVTEVWRAGYVPVSENTLIQLCRDGLYRHGWMGRRRVVTGKQHHQNVLRMTGRADVAQGGALCPSALSPTSRTFSSITGNSPIALDTIEEATGEHPDPWNQEDAV